MQENNDKNVEQGAKKRNEAYLSPAAQKLVAIAMMFVLIALLAVFIIWVSNIYK